MTSQPAATLRSRYVEQAASDLQENRRRQQELAESLTVLKEEEALLLDILTLAERHGFAPDGTPSLPAQSSDEPALTPVPATDDAAPAAKGTPPQPLLGDLLAHLLSTYEEPRHAKELREELLEKHPDRQPTPQVVRNTLESLVAKGRIRRHKQRRSVMYSLV